MVGRRPDGAECRSCKSYSAEGIFAAQNTEVITDVGRYASGRGIGYSVYVPRRQRALAKARLSSPCLFPVVNNTSCTEGDRRKSTGRNIDLASENKSNLRAPTMPWLRPLPAHIYSFAFPSSCSLLHVPLVSTIIGHKWLIFSPLISLAFAPSRSASYGVWPALASALSISYSVRP
jgi:hypothetical protein